MRQVRTNGQIKWKGDMIYLSWALKGEPVGLVPQDDRYWTIWFGPLSIGLLDDHDRTVCIRLQKCHLCPRFKCYLCPRLHSEGE